MQGDTKVRGTPDPQEAPRTPARLPPRCLQANTAAQRCRDGCQPGACFLPSSLPRTPAWTVAARGSLSQHPPVTRQSKHQGK